MHLVTIATRSPARSGPHSVASAAADVVEAVSELGRPPDIVIGHSFGGKVHALALADGALLYDAFDAR
jgi:pimeloyl-ACP methyl ester carboxylesterase